MADWKLVYAADSSGVRTAGSLEELHLAASRGGDIKVGSGGSTRYCPSVTAWIGDEGVKIVTATYSDAIATVLVPGKVGLAGRAPLFLDYHVYNSNGLHSSARRDVESGTIDFEFGFLAMNWYARDYTRPLWPWIVGLVGRLGGRFRREP